MRLPTTIEFRNIAKQVLKSTNAREVLGHTWTEKTSKRNLKRRSVCIELDSNADTVVKLVNDELLNQQLFPTAIKTGKRRTYIRGKATITF